MEGLDALIVAALPEEFEAARLAALARDRGGPGVTAWQPRDEDNPTPFIAGTYVTASGDRMSVALARPTRMGVNATTPVASSLIERLRPRCVAMCGVCAGNPADVSLGDVIVAELAYAHDEGKRTPDGFDGDLRQIPMPDLWVRAAQELDPGGLPSHGAPPPSEALLWLLERLHAGEEPTEHTLYRRYFTARSWAECLDAAQREGLLRRADGRLSITQTGRGVVRDGTHESLDGPSRLPFRVAVGPMASGSFVVSDGMTWDRLRERGVRTTLGIDLEAAAIANTAHRLGVPHWAVVKGVMDHADQRKNDRYKAFAARASAEVLFKYLATLLPQQATPAVATVSGRGRQPTPEGRDVVTVLHLPGPRFDAALQPADAPRRATELLERLAGLDGGGPVLPDLVVVTGDLAASARTAEYDRAYAFLSTLCDGLGLGTDRLVTVPGTGDVNRMLCQAYFLTRQAADEEPVPPYWPKWEPYAALFTRLHTAEFPRDEPWSLLEVPELRVVVAGLNSTMAASHEDTGPGGRLGERQLRWFAERLRQARERGWLRIGAVHHAPSPVDDGAGLHDAKLFDELLGAYLNVVLCGSTTGDGTAVMPVLGSPDTAVAGPDRYRVVRIGREGVATRASWDSARWTRRPVPGGMRDVGATFPAARQAAVEPANRPRPPARPRADLVSRIAEICRLRLPDASLREVRSSGPAPSYLHVAVVRVFPDGRPVAVEQYPIGACESTATIQDIDRFIDSVDVLYRTGGAAVPSKLVYAGPPADPEVRRYALRRGVELLSFPVYQLGYDLRPYAQRQAERLARDDAYPPALYIPQRYVEIDGHGSAPKVSPVREDLLERLRGWLAEPDGHVIIVLGPFGHGKTFLLQQLARQMHADGDPVVPVLVHLRDLEKAHDLNQLVAAQLTAGGERRIDLTMFRYLLREGRIALLFDGFDELAIRVTYQAVAGHLDRILQAAEGRAKVVIASRDQHFLTDAEVLSALGDRLATVAGRRLVKLAHFNDDQIAAFVRTRMGERAAERWLELLRDVQDLLGLSRNPRMLEFITRIDEEKLRAARLRTGEITAAVLYDELLDAWQVFEHRHHKRPGGAPPPSKEQFWHAVTYLALRLWTSTERALGPAELGDAADALAAMSAPDGQAEQAALDREVTTHAIGSQTLLVRDGEGRFTFVHQSVMEFLVARHMATQIARRNRIPEVMRREMSPLMVDFLCDLAGRGTALDWAREILADAEAPDTAGENALLILRRLGVEAAEPARLAGRRLRGADLSGQTLHGADLSRADLTEANLSNADLTGADLTGACLVRARLDRAYLSNAALRGTDLSGASLLGADLTGSDLTDAVLWRAALIGATVSPEALGAAATTWGAALPDADPPLLQIRSAAARVRVVAFGRHSDVVASGGADGMVRVYDAASGAVVREFVAYTSAIVAIQFSPDGRWLAVAGDSGVQIWDAAAGVRVRELAPPCDGVLSLTFSPDGRWLAAAVDTLVRVWDAATGRVADELAGPYDGVRAVAYSPDGRWLAVAGADRVVRIWDPGAHTLVHELVGPSGRVLSLAFSPDGRWLAGGASDFLVWIWDPESGAVVRQLSGHTDWVLSLAFSPDGTWLASASDDAVVRLWAAASEALVREVGGQAGGDCVAFSPDGRWLATAGPDRAVRLWDPGTAALVRQLAAPTDWTLSARFSPDGTRLASAGDDGVVRIWDVATGAMCRELTGHTETVWTARYSPDGRWLASAGHDRVVRIWDADTGTLARELTGHFDAVWAVAFSPDGRLLASGGADPLIRIWDVATGTTLSGLAGHTDGVWAVRFSPDGRLLASAGVDRLIRIWDPLRGTVVRWFPGHTDVVRSLAFSPDGRLLATGGNDHVVRLWSFEGTAPVRELTGHSRSVHVVKFSPDGRLLVSAGDDRIIRLWDVATGESAGTLPGPCGAMWSAVFSPDGRWLASVGDSRAIRLWDMTDRGRYVDLLPLPNGWAAFGHTGRYKIAGTPGGEFWHVSGLRRFEAGELDPYLPCPRAVPADAPLRDLLAD